MLDRVMIGKRIRDCRRNAGISQDFLAEKAGLSTPYVSKIENARKKASLDALVEIASVLQISTDYLLFGEQCCSSFADSPLQGLMQDLSPKEQMVMLGTMEALKKALREYFCPQEHSL
ncbi:MAG: helix-turn-helix transcriptional regulator [Mailhella sp.]|nr:helix-turn-helix transcriptional regulator [Mailhella sp.]